MARPKIDEKAKRVAVSISVPQSIKEAAEDSGNASRYFEHAVRACVGIQQIVGSLGKRVTKEAAAEALDMIADVVIAWSRIGEETEPFVMPEASPAPRKAPTKRARKAS